MIVQFVTHAGCIATGVGIAFSRVCLFVCLSVCSLSKRKNGLSYRHQTLYTLIVIQSLGIHWSKGQKVKRQCYTVTKTVTVARLLLASDACCYGRVLLLLAWICMLDDVTEPANGHADFFSMLCARPRCKIRLILHRGTTKHEMRSCSHDMLCNGIYREFVCVCHHRVTETPTSLAAPVGRHAWR